MLEQVISYGSERIITIYHKGFDKDVGNRHKKVSEKLGRFQLVFEEKVVPDEEPAKYMLNGWSIKGLLGNANALNPYGESACAFLEQIVSIHKPNCLFTEDKEYKLKVDVPTFQKICSFSKKYTGIDFSKTPMSFGNVLFYSSFETNLHALKEEGIIVKGNHACDLIIVHFKQNDMVVCTRMIEATGFPPGWEIEVLSNVSWNNHDIEIYDDENLVYFYKGITYLRNIVMNMTVLQRGHDIPLKKLGKAFRVEDQGSSTKTTIGEKRPIIQEKLERSEVSIRRKLNEEEMNQDTLFVKPNEIQKAMDFIQKELKKTSKQIWLFDSYFSDRNGLHYSLDWIRIFAFLHADEKNIVFFNNPSKPERNPVTAKEFSYLTKEDPTIRMKKQKDKSLGIRFYQTKQYIHDRFLFILDKEEFVTGISIGTSLNSLDSNYYCIHKLYKGSARHIFDELKQFSNLPNIEDISSV
ncbi:hypothetical protein K0T92_18370 [Paenibacillus oenotherae]|uniref:Uncharacterized protein n=1 Tax=Paenibacillus oenotherae TaxID=1435645 RepID=A0ABS7D9R5_9BACL|nr:hypothetical protein [Paenibacillus oenotherae]MBW7476687.1 hypothetical protein [Paenibacillus oenotherae]